MGLRAQLREAKNRLLGRPVHRALKKYGPLLEAINSNAPQLLTLQDEELKQRARDLGDRIRAEGSSDDHLAGYFALVRETAFRTVGLRPFDVQMIGGLALHQGNILEMQTGEGKTLAAVAPVAFNALRGNGVHVLTFNDYLARRDANWMGPIYKFLGLTVGHVDEDTDTESRRAAYECDITYVTAKQAGFDYLRDCLAYETGDLVHRPFDMALVDEADSLMIDEARIPLVIAAAAGDRRGRLAEIMQAVRSLKPGVDYIADEDKRTAHLTDEGMDRVEVLLKCTELHALENLPELAMVNVALHAHTLMRRDVDYIVREGRIEVVDEFTGRVVKDRQWPDGLQAAIETKEGLVRSGEGRILGSMTLQHFLKRYPKLCGMTATAVTASEELNRLYDLEVQVVPPNQPCVRDDAAMRLFRTREAKVESLHEEIATVHRTGRPVLVGTVSVRESESLAHALTERDIPCQVLNAKQDAQEAVIVADAGGLGAVTISTNMAGRGTDIRLGGKNEADREAVLKLGGLYVIGTNLYESRRIDDQLRGRAGRQGDPGSSRFFVSLEDSLLSRVGIADSPYARELPNNGSKPIDRPSLVKEVERAQRVVEGKSLDIRQSLFHYSRFLERQRRVLQIRRDAILGGEVADGPLRDQKSGSFTEACHRFGKKNLLDLERRLQLLAVDEAWEEHLAVSANLRESVHLTELGGLQPLDQFQREASRMFDALEEGLDARVIQLFDDLNLEENLDLEAALPRGPSATWTYLVIDTTFEDRLAAALISQRNIGFAATAAFQAPLLLLWALLKRWRDGKKRPPSNP